MLCNDPRQATIINGNAIQILTNKQVRLEVLGSVSQGIGATLNAPNIRLIGPKDEFNKPFHTNTVIVEGSAQGRIRINRYILRSRIFLLDRSKARKIPMANDTTVDKTAQDVVHERTSTNSPLHKNALKVLESNEFPIAQMSQ